jgi:transcriptional regulator with XRE-family HTH domain
MKDPENLRPEEIGPFLKEQRIARRMKEIELAKATNLSTRYIGLIENGVVIPTLQRIKRIARVLGFSIDPFREALGEASPRPRLTVPDLNLDTLGYNEDTQFEDPDENIHTLSKNHEQRRHQRLSVDFVTTCRVENREWFFSTVNVSQCGMGIILTKPFPIRCRMALTLKAQGQKIEMNAELLWLKEGDRHGVWRGGLEITEITPSMRALYEKILNKELGVDEV